jgi:undecaprenyl-diphosphatase
MGTMAAVLLYFRHDLWGMTRALLRSIGDRTFWHSEEENGRLGWYIVLGTIPISVLGLAFKDQIEHQARTLEVVGLAMMLFSAVLWQADRTGSRDRDIHKVNMRDGIVIGFAQALALIPGVSRSGATISFGLFQGFTREAAARYSFLLSVPAVVLSGLFELRKVGEGNSAGAAPTAVATIFAFIFGYLTIAWLLRYIRTHTFEIFVVYRVIVGFAVFALAAGGVIN